MRALAILAVAVLLAVPAAGLAATPLQPLVAGWEQYFKLDWQSDLRAGQPLVSGHVLNDWGFPAKNVRILVDAVDASGAIVDQRVAWLGSTLTPGARAYFEVPMPQVRTSAAARAYRVSVFAFDWVQSGGDHR